MSKVVICSLLIATMLLAAILLLRLAADPYYYTVGSTAHTAWTARVETNAHDIVILDEKVHCQKSKAHSVVGTRTRDQHLASHC